MREVRSSGSIPRLKVYDYDYAISLLLMFLMKLFG